MANFLDSFTLLLLLTFSHNFQLVKSHRSSINYKYYNKIFNVLDYGAIGDGSSDDTKAFEKSWEDACNYIGYKSIIQIPQEKTFLLQPISFVGPCKSNNIVFLISGKLIAPENIKHWKCNGKCERWITFAHVNGLYIDGHGTIDGQGSNWWSLDCKKHKSVCLQRPRGVTISHSTNVHISNINVKDSPNFQMSLEDSNWVSVKHLTITADGESPNTDGIHIQRSQNVEVYHSIIRTGDDCISIGDGSKYIEISKISCGPGHGISIGSLGRHGSTETVENVMVRDSIFNKTDNGVRIKTWQGGKGYVKNVLFERIKLYDTTRPIIVDQFYCPHSTCKNHTDAVKISNIAFSHIHGTSNKNPSIQLLCSDSFPCKNIYMDNINIINEDYETSSSSSSSHHHHHHHHHHNHDDNPPAECINVQGESKGFVRPQMSCLVSNIY